MEYPAHLPFLEKFSLVNYFEPVCLSPSPIVACSPSRSCASFHGTVVVFYCRTVPLGDLTSLQRILIALHPHNFDKIPFSIFDNCILNSELHEIRVLELQPALLSSSPICVRLSKAFLSDSPVYHALSYVWGTSRDTESIFVNGRQLGRRASYRREPYKRLHL
jgi:hypothetical protein